MASGHSRRFGSNKLLADFDGVTLVERAILATDGIFRKRVVVTRYPEIVRICARLGVECVLHSLPDRRDTIRLGLEQMEDMQGCMFVPSDQPLLKRETVAALAETFTADRSSIWRLSSGGEVGMPVVFPRELFCELSSLTHGGGASIIKKHPELLRLFEIENRAELLDADTPEKLLELGEL